MDDLADNLTPSTTTMLAIHRTPPSNPRPLPVREDCWSEEATATLVDAWGRRYLELNRGNLRQKDWQDVADAVNALHGLTKKTHRTDVQCKNRVDTIKKKYKIEKARITSSNGTLTSSWPFYDRMDSLIGSNVTLKKPSMSPKFSPPLSMPPPAPSRFSPPVALPLPYKKAGTPTAVPALPQKRASPDDAYFRRNYSAIAAAAAAAESEEDEEEMGEDEEEREGGNDGEDAEDGGVRSLARAIEKFGEVYQRIEADKLRQMVELEKQRMQFAKDLEVQRMKMFMDTQLQLERMKRGKRSGSTGESRLYSIVVKLLDTC